MTGQETEPITAVYPGPGTTTLTVQAPGWDTVTFPAIRDDGEPCKCGMCPGADPGEKGALLSCGPGVVTLMWRARIRNGQWEDIHAAVLAGRERVHQPALAKLGGICNDLDCGWHSLAAVFRANPAVRTDPLLAASLRKTADTLAARLDEDRRRSAERWGSGVAA